jgi:hypothetical protein
LVDCQSSLYRPAHCHGLPLAQQASTKSRMGELNEQPSKFDQLIVGAG